MNISCESSRACPSAQKKRRGGVWNVVRGRVCRSCEQVSKRRKASGARALRERDRCSHFFCTTTSASGMEPTARVTSTESAFTTRTTRYKPLTHTKPCHSSYSPPERPPLLTSTTFSAHAYESVFQHTHRFRASCTHGDGVVRGVHGPLGSLFFRYS